MTHRKNKSSKTKFGSKPSSPNTKKSSNRSADRRGRRSFEQDVPSSAIKNYVEGLIDMKQTGKAYLLPDNKDLEDIFIGANNTKNALNGDRVRVYLFPHRPGRRLEGQVSEILQRNKKQIVGVLELSPRFSFVIPDDPSNAYDFFIPNDKLNGAKDGDKVIVQFTEWPERLKNPIGEIKLVLGRPGDNNVEMQSILAEFDFPVFYPKEAEQEANHINSEISAAEINKRKDFRGVYTCTIDPFDAKDFDDAISFKSLPNGNFEIGVHIADVSHYVKAGSLVDQEAYNRGTSVYLVDRTIPMLPERLCNDLCSLRPNEDKLCFSAVFEIDSSAQVVETWIGRTIIHSNHRLTYEQAQEVIEDAGLAETSTNAEENDSVKASANKTDSEKNGTNKVKASANSKKNIKKSNTGTYEFITQEGVNALIELQKLADILRKRRFQTGAINFHTQEVRFKLDSKGKPLGVYIKESKESNHLVEEFMLLANKKVAESIGKIKKGRSGEAPAAKTFVYRVHDEPNPEKLQTFMQFVAKLGYKINNRSRSRLADSFNTLLDNIKGKGEENMIETIAVRTMSKAYYSTKNIGHYGLSFPYYSHFTSPIRRYPDLMVHRLLELYLAQKPSVKADEIEEQCEYASLMERKAAEAERASVKYKQAEFLADKVGENFEGIISGISKWGIFVVIQENYCEGMVSLKTLTDDQYELDDENYQVVGKFTHKKYKLGDKVTIKVQSVDLNKKQLNFLFA